MWQLDHKKGWGLKNWCFWPIVLEKTLESLLDCKEIQPVNPKGNQPWIFIGRTDAEAEAPIRWSPDAKKWLLGKDSDVGKDWGQEKGTIEDEMVGWRHRFNGHEFEQTPGDCEGQRSLVSYKSMGSQRDAQLSSVTSQSKGLSKLFSSTTVQKHRFFGIQPSLWYNSHIHIRLLENP